ncbi:MAG: helix-turn-helix transcriptional regulator [Chitinophaga sp.]|uniref:helix-turn-helix transcriptional regulator n=1 Tax=Chitinophaga sp. TaxID=1869181 RepID=UPI001B295B90|nr:AraC family transcriptional regulator [Chitinophaga sp.]MBO9727392.1 helix-turn-helix transcriptional regulator [Chitinophaga sp.]
MDIFALPSTAADYHKIFSPGKGIVQERALPFEDKPGRLTVALLKDMGLVDSRFHTSQPTAAWKHVNNTFVEMGFILEGDFYQTQDGFTSRQLCTRGSHNILYNPLGVETNEVLGQGHYRSFGVHMKPEKMSELFVAYVPALEPFAEKLYMGKPFLLAAPGQRVTAKMKYIFDTIWQGPQPDGLKQLYLESKVLDLFALQCEALLEAPPKKATLSGGDIDKLYAARLLLEQRLEQPPTLTELAKLCQLNEFRLKSGFRELFHTTVHGFIQTSRLTRAEQMIRDRQGNISEIAYQLGYSHPQHFQRAFKKQFGITPGSLLQ